ncbi:hypothetical protein [Microbulbifer marinus]|uniref:hypothetical protein n=1 Tax=Microbulbifer marinus TaxID=658218 RepID=UPI000B840FC6|nr:hypothetical protein [Microbulbifer marinus]
MKKGLVLLLVSVLAACGVGAEQKTYTKTEIIQLSEYQIGNLSFDTAEAIGTAALANLKKHIQENPGKYDLNKIGCRINWGENKSIGGDEKEIYVRVVSISLAPIEETPAVIELSEYAQEFVKQEISKYQSQAKL